MSKLENKLSNFSKALLRLKEAAIEFENNKTNDVIRDGVIQRFEFTYELAWKATKEYLEDIGITDRNSPKAVIKEAYAQKIIVHEQNWLFMLNDRNMTTHVYNEQMAQEIIGRITLIYLKEFEQLLQAISR
jgi:nucleotidyltransferase substrate binding protein (TIGR01987 family)